MSMSVKAVSPYTVIAKKNPRTGQWEFDPPFKGGGYYAWKQYHKKCMDACDAVEPRRTDTAPDFDPDQIDWVNLSPEKFNEVIQNIDPLEHSTTVLTLIWDGGDVFASSHYGVVTIERIGDVYFVDDSEADGFRGPYFSMKDAFVDSEYNVMRGITESIVCELLSTKELAGLLDASEVGQGTSLLISGQEWRTSSKGEFERAK